MSIVSLVGRSVSDLVGMGYPESVAKKISSGELPMDDASRMQRAKDQGFDVDEMFYHGTPHAQSIADYGFDPSYLGKGNDQMGAGFYFSSNPNQASGYAQGDGAGIFPVFLKSSGSHEVDIDSPAGFGIEANEPLASALIARAPDIRDEYGPLSDHIPPSSPSGYTDADIRSVAENYVGSDVDIIQGDVYRDDASSFLDALTKETGVDSIVTVSDDAADPTVRTVFRPDQIRSPNAAFDSEYKGGSLLGGLTPVAPIAGVLSALPQDAEADPMTDGIGFEPQMGFGEYMAGMGMRLLDLLGPDMRGNVGDGTLYGNEYQ